MSGAVDTDHLPLIDPAKPFADRMIALIEAIHRHCADSGRRFAVAAAGAGSSAISKLLSVPGASATVLEAKVPYGKRAFEESISPCADFTSPGKVRGFVSTEGAVRLAASSYERCAHLIEFSGAQPFEGEILKPVGAAVTSAVVTSSERKGFNLSYACVLGGGDLRRSSNTATIYATRLKQGAGRTRAEEEDICGNILIAAMGESIGDEGLSVRVRRRAQDSDAATPTTAASSSLVKPSEWIGQIFKPLRTIDLCSADAAGSADIDMDIRVPASLPEDTVVRATVPLPSPLQRLLKLKDAAPPQLPLTCGTSAAPPTSPFAHLPPLAQQVATWLPPVTHVVFSPVAPKPTKAASSSLALVLADQFLILPNVPLCDDCAADLSHTATDAFVDAFDPAAMALPSIPLPTVVVAPGSFNPVHEGHVGMAEAAKRVLESMWAERLKFTTKTAPKEASPASPASPLSPSASVNVKVKIVFELSATNVDKPPLSMEEVERRVAQFASSNNGTGAIDSPGAGYPVVVTREPRFFEKGRLFPRGCAFVLGFDTVTRLLDPKYYGSSETSMVQALMGLKLQGALVFVAGRVAEAGRFMTFGKDLASKVPALLEGLFVEIPEHEFRADVSSTELRKRLGQQAAASSSAAPAAAPMA